MASSRTRIRINKLKEQAGMEEDIIRKIKIFARGFPVVLRKILLEMFKDFIKLNEKRIRDYRSVNRRLLLNPFNLKTYVLGFFKEEEECEDSTFIEKLEEYVKEKEQSNLFEKFNFFNLKSNKIDSSTDESETLDSSEYTEESESENSCSESESSPSKTSFSEDSESSNSFPIELVEKNSLNLLFSKLSLN